MTQEDLLKTLVKQLFAISETHYEYQDNQSNFIIDAKKENPDELVIRVKNNKNKDKEEFENFVDSMDDDLFNEVWESLSEENNLHNLNELYDSPQYKEVINKFKNRTKEIVSNKIKDLQKYL